MKVICVKNNSDSKTIGKVYKVLSIYVDNILMNFYHGDDNKLYHLDNNDDDFIEIDILRERKLKELGL